jgi:hypothetical protein
VKFVGNNEVTNGLMENAAPVEIRIKRGFPPPLGKASTRNVDTFPHFPQAVLGPLSFEAFCNASRPVRKRAVEGNEEE